MSFFFSSFHSVVLLKIPHAPREPPVPRFPSLPRPTLNQELVGRKGEAKRPRGGPGAGPASVVGLGDETLFPKVESCGDSYLISRQSAFLSPLPHPASRRGLSFSSRPRSATWASREGGAFSRFRAARCPEAAAGAPLRGRRLVGGGAGPVAQCP